ncbi:MAG TPA: hypothetical protein VFV38_29890 [Ktedonobacteraceae bacterium]|nr:hypothetical protein [Ktedonobacteraceae bacterium]
MKEAFAILDLKSVKCEYEKDAQYTKKYIKKIYSRRIDPFFISEISRKEIFEWLTRDIGISPRRTLFREDCVTWLDRIRKRFPTAWKLNNVKTSLRCMDIDKERGVRPNTDVILFFDSDEKTRQAVIDLYDPRVRVFSSLKGIADSMDIAPEEFDLNDPEEAAIKRIIEMKAEIKAKGMDTETEC